MPAPVEVMLLWWGTDGDLAPPRGQRSVVASVCKTPPVREGSGQDGSPAAELGWAGDREADWMDQGEILASYMGI